MTINSEQIQALKAAADYKEKHSRLWERFDESAHDNAEHMRNILQSALDVLESAERLILKTQKQVLPFLAERDADKALIAEQAKRIAELEASLKAAEINETDARCHVAELEARTLTVKLPSQTDFDDPLSAYEAIEKCRDALSESCASAGITLDVGE